MPAKDVRARLRDLEEKMDPDKAAERDLRRSNFYLALYTLAALLPAAVAVVSLSLGRFMPNGSDVACLLTFGVCIAAVGLCMAVDGLRLPMPRFMGPLMFIMMIALPFAPAVAAAITMIVGHEYLVPGCIFGFLTLTLFS